MPEEQPAEEQPTHISLRFNWHTADDVRFSVANQFLLQVIDDGYLLSFGQVRPPALIDTTREEREAISEISVQILGSVSLTPERTRALMLLLERQLKRFSPELLAEPLTESEGE